MEVELQQINEIYQLITRFLVEYSFQLLGALVILLLGIVVAGKVGNTVRKLCLARKVDVTLSRFIGSTVKMVLVVMVVIVALGKMGISVTPFVAAVGALTFGVSLAAQGLISNYGAGINIILGRPFVVGDTITVCEVTGQVTEVTLGYTRMINEDKVIITIPNKHIIGEILHNSSAVTLVEAEVGVAYGSDMDQAITVVREAIMATEGVPENCEPLVGIDNFGDSSVNLGLRFPLPTERFFELKYAVNKNIFAALKNAGIEIPFPQREVLLRNESQA